MGWKAELLHDRYGVSEVNRVEHGSLTVFDVDAVMKHNPTNLTCRCTEHHARFRNRMSTCDFQISQLYTFIVGRIDVVEQVEKEPGHGPPKQTLQCGSQSSLGGGRVLASIVVTVTARSRRMAHDRL